VIVFARSDKGDWLIVTKDWYLRYFADGSITPSFAAGKAPPEAWFTHDDEFWGKSGWNHITRQEVHDEHVSEESA
jgi:hypothetical protein